jgi:erythromycin esterase
MKTQTLRFFATFFIALILVACDKNNASLTTENEIKQILESQNFKSLIHPFSATPSDNTNDMQSILPLVEGKEIIAFGEATHGSAEFQTISHRLLQVLVTQKGFKSLIIEENFSAVAPLNKYILTGQGNVNELQANLRSSIFKTQEFKNIINWMRTYNATKTEANKIHLFGMDAQNTGYSAKAAQAIINQFDPDYLNTYNTLASSFLSDLTNFTSDKEFIDALPDLKIKVTQIKIYLEENATPYGGTLSDNYKFVVKHIHIIEQALNQFSGFVESPDDGFETRDANMTENVSWIKTYLGENSKVLVWAHNGHVSKQLKTYFNKPIKVLGTNLKDKYGDTFYTIGTKFNEESFNAVGYDMLSKPYTVKPYKTAYLAKALSAQNQSVFLFDYKAANNEIIRKILDKEYDTYLVGATYRGVEADVIIPVNYVLEFDSFVFINRVNAYTPIQ